MRRNRIILLMLWLLSLIGITFVGGQLSYGLFFLFSLIPLVSLVYIYQYINTHDLIADHAAVSEFALQNDSIIPFAGIRVIFFPGFSFVSGLDSKAEYEIFPHSSIKKKTSIICRYRGEYCVGIQAVVIQDFFRLFSFVHKNRNPLLVRVKPNIIRLDDLRQVQLAYNAVSESRAKRSTADILVREYVSGDDPRLINWKVSAALNKLMVREQIGEEQQGVGIVVDSKRYSEKPEDCLPAENKVLEAIIALNLFFSDRGIPVSTCFETEGLQEIDADRDHGFNEVYEKLSSFVFYRDHKSEKLCADILSSGSVMSKVVAFFIVQKWDASFSFAAQQLRKRGTPVFIYAITRDPDACVSEAPSSDKADIVFVDPDQDLKEVL